MFVEREGGDNIDFECLCRMFRRSGACRGLSGGAFA